eukprot:COSAG02_NODE_26664_length_628_cov_0.536862_2_plen_46_part_01
MRRPEVIKRLSMTQQEAPTRRRRLSSLRALIKSPYQRAAEALRADE